MRDLIDENEAAIFLGITKELLYSFVRTGIKGRKLKTGSSAHNNFFSKDDLTNWNTFLTEAWSLSSSSKPEIPKSIKDYLRVESGGKCVRCGNGHRLDNAHIDPWNTSLSHHPHNLIRLCTDCHVKFDDGIISIDEIKLLKKGAIAKIKAEILSHVGLKSNSIYGLPFHHPIFIGRELELKKLKTLYLNHRFILIEGIGGIGKTQLVLQFIKSENIDVAWFSLEKYDRLIDFQVALAAFFNVSSTEELVSFLDEDQITLVLDGFEKLLINEWDESAEFLASLCNNTKRAKFLVISQIDFPDISLAPVSLKITDGLEIGESLIVLRSRLPHVNPDKFLSKLCIFSDGHPLTLVIMSGLIQFMKTAELVNNAIEEMGVKVLENPKHKQQTKSTSLDICLSIGYQLFESRERWLLKYLSHFPAGCKTHFLSILTKQQREIFTSETELRKSLSTLEQFNFIQLSEDLLQFERAHLLNPVREFIKKEASNESRVIAHTIKLEAFHNLVIEAIILYQEHMLSDKIVYAMMRYEIELPNYLNAFRSAVHSAYCEQCNKYSERKEYLRIITGMTAGLYKYLFTRGHFSYGISFNKEGAKAHVELGEYDLAIDDLLQVAAYYWRRYDRKEAENILKTIISYEDKIGKKMPQVRMLAGEIMQSKDPKKAIEIFNEGVVLCEEGLNTYDSLAMRGNMAMLFGEIGRTYERYLHDEKAALPFLLKGYKISKEIKDIGNMYCASHHLGNAYAGLNDPVNAIKYYKEALKGFVELGQQQYISNSLGELGKMRMEYRQADFSFLNKHLLEVGLQDIENEIRLSHKVGDKNQKSLNGNLPDEIVFKLWNIIKIVSLSKFSNLLALWSEELIKLFEPGDKMNYRPSYPWFFLKIAKVSVVVEKKSSDNHEFMKLKLFCYLLGGEVEHDIYDPYEWLAFWLKEKNILNTTRDALFAEVENMDDDDE